MAMHEPFESALAALIARYEDDGETPRSEIDAALAMHLTRTEPGPTGNKDGVPFVDVLDVDPPVSED